MSDKPRRDPVDAACLMNERAREALAAANLPRAERLARRAVAVMARDVGERHSDHVAALLTLASTLEMRGDLAVAEEAFRRAAAAMEAIAVDHPAVHLLLVQSLIALGNLLRVAGATPKPAPSSSGRSGGTGTPAASEAVSQNPRRFRSPGWRAMKPNPSKERRQ